jgi:hypothetical protein
MYRYKILNRIKLNYFLKFIIHELNSKIVKSKKMVLTEREKSNAHECYNILPEC